MIHLSDDERTELRDTARRMLSDRSSSLRVRDLLESRDGYDPQLWSSMAELGWLAVCIPDDQGGMGASYTDLAVVLHELGRQVTPSPMLASVVLGGSALMGAANDALAAEVLPAIASGELVLTAALSSDTGSYEVSRLTVGWSTVNGAVVFDGTTRFVPDGHVADHIVVAATDPDGRVCLALVDREAAGVSVEVERTYDQTRRLAKLTMSGVVVSEERLLCEPEEGQALHSRLTSIGAIAVMCDAVGAAEHILEISTEYAKQRRQFGRPIGSFQAVKHHLANMFADVEASRAAVTYAVDTIDGGGDVGHAASVAKSFAGPACARVASLAVQVHGGIGFTWEHDAHLFLKRTKLAEAMFGSASWHRRHLAELLIDQQMPI